MNKIIAPIGQRQRSEIDNIPLTFTQSVRLPQFGNRRYDEEQKPQCFGCPDDKKLNKDIYNDMMEQVAQKSSLDIKDPEQRKTAHKIILPIFRERVRENKKYIQQDREGPPVAEGPEFIINENGIYYPQFQKSLQQMYKDQKRIRPWLYNEKEHATMTMVEGALTHGATLVKHVSHNKDSEGNEVIRDQIILRWDSITQKGTMEIRNIARDGNFHSIEKALDIMRGESSGMAEIHPTDGVGIFVDKPLPSEHVSSILLSHHVGEVFDIPQLIARDTAKTVGYVGSRLRDDVGEMITVMKDRIGEDVKNKFVIPPFLKRLLGNEEDNEKDKVMSISTILSKDQLDVIFHTWTPEEAEKKISSEKSMVLWKKHIEQMLHISSEQSEKLFFVLKKTEQTMHNIADVIAISTKTAVAIGGSVELLQKFSTLNFEHIQEGTQQTTNDLITTIVCKEHGKEIVQVKQIKILIERANIIPERSTNKKNTDNVVIIWLKDFVQSIDKQTPEVAVEKIETEQQRIEVRIQRISEVFREHTTLEIQEPTVYEFSFAIMAWMILKYISYYERLESVKKAVITIQLKDLNAAKSHLSEAITAQESATSWLLFAIIWYLAMIREQGAIQASGAKYQAKQAKKQTFQNPLFVNVPIRQYAVIYPS
jgi:hypothetical protein